MGVLAIKHDISSLVSQSLDLILKNGSLLS